MRVSANGGVDAAARIQSSITGRIKLRNTLPPLASNDLFGGAQLGQHAERIQAAQPFKRRRQSLDP
jgi:hypothetical protein